MRKRFAAVNDARIKTPRKTDELRGKKISKRLLRASDAQANDRAEAHPAIPR
jgi:hypothetical protein